MKFEELPNEIFILITTHLSLDEVGNLGLSSKQLYLILTSDDVSRHFLQRNDKNLFITNFKRIVNESKNMFQAFVVRHEDQYASFCPYTRVSAIGRSKKQSLKKLLLILGFLSHHHQPISLTKDISSLHEANSKSLESVEEYLFSKEDECISAYLIGIPSKFVLYCPKFQIFTIGDEISTVVGLMEKKMNAVYEYQDVCKEIVCTAPHRIVGNQYAILNNSKLEWRETIDPKMKRLEYYFHPNQLKGPIY